jgi:hypothetical protein
MSADLLVDNAMSNRGEMGWGEYDTDSLETRLKIERDRLEVMQNIVPNRFSASLGKEPNQVVLAKVKAAMQADGIEDGFDPMYLHQVVFGTWPRWLAQIIGSCVASGGMRACTLRTLVEVVLLGEPEETLGGLMVGRDNINHFAPYSYRAGRKIGGLNRGDGSFCEAHIQGLMQYGFLPCDTGDLDSDTFPEPQSASDYRRWGNSDALLNRFAPAAQKYDLVTSSHVKSADDWIAACKDRFETAMICSMWAFAPAQQHPTWRLANGQPVWIYRRNPRDSWAHNMTLCGYIQHGGKWYVKVLNSWHESSHKNGFWFVIPIEEFARWIPSAQSQTIGDLALRDSSSPIAW